MLTQLAIVNETSDVTADDVNAICAVLNYQVATQFCLAWGFAPTLITPYQKVTDVPDGPDYGILRLVDSDSDPEALGWHSETAGDRVIGIISHGAVLAANGVVLLDESDPTRLTLASVVSHEVLETLADQFINAWADGPRIEQGDQYAWEVCDPVEGDQYVIDIPGVAKAAVSNFVWPSWFDPDATGQVDQLATSPGPFKLAPAGYMVVRDGTQTSQVFAYSDKSRLWRLQVGGAKAPGFRSARRRASWNG